MEDNKMKHPEIIFDINNIEEEAKKVYDFFNQEHISEYLIDEIRNKEVYSAKPLVFNEAKNPYRINLSTMDTIQIPKALISYSLSSNEDNKNTSLRTTLHSFSQLKKILSQNPPQMKEKQNEKIREIDLTIVSPDLGDTRTDNGWKMHKPHRNTMLVQAG